MSAVIPVIIFLLSIAMQFAAAVYALLLIRITGRKSAWILIAVAMVLMTSRRMVSFVSILTSDKKFTYEIAEVIALIIAFLMLAGVLRIRRYFQSIKSAEAGRRDAEEALKKSENMYRTIAEASNDIIFIVNREDRVEYLNAFGAGLFGLKPEEVIGKQREALFPKSISDDQKAKLTDVFKTGLPLYTETKTPFPKGELWLGTLLVPMHDVSGAAVGVMGISRDVTERKIIEESLRERESKLSTITNTAADAILMVDEQGKITYWNPAAEKILGFTADEAVGKDMPLLIIPHRYRDIHGKAFRRFVETGHLLKLRKTYEVSALKKDGSEIPVELSISGVRIKDRCYSVGIIRDITERKGLESQLLHSQKMEAIGVLAGGIAHDFNNILTAIIGYAGVTQMKIKEDDPLRHNIEQIIASAERAATLTQGLLAFSRKQITNPLPVNLNDLINREGRLISRIIGEDVAFETALSEEVLVVMADSGQLEQVFMNLATNARDAMPDGGRLIIETEKVEIDEEYIKMHGYGKPGMYALATVSDSGMGMDETTRQKIFEPFFTTKQLGKGTGLGLSIVYGIVKQHNGYINCYSEPGKGTAFKIYLPLSGAEVAKIKPAEPVALLKGTETILVAEDEEAVRKLAKTVLEEFGYKVIEAVDGEDAVARFMENRDGIDLFFADVVMPKMSGKEAYELIKKIRPDIKALLTSGYPTDFIHRQEALKEELHFIAKPLSPTALLKTVREILDRKG